jgi:hypothetical protein
MSQTVLEADGWPRVFEMDVGQSHELVVDAPGGTIRRTIRLSGIEHFWEPDYWVAENRDRRTVRAAAVRLTVSGEGATLVARPYQMPVEVNGLRFYVETTKVWADFGDGTPTLTLDAGATHAFAAPGLYTATVRGAGPGDGPVTARMRVVVEREEERGGGDAVYRFEGSDQSVPCTQRPPLSQCGMSTATPANAIAAHSTPSASRRSRKNSGSRSAAKTGKVEYASSPTAKGPPRPAAAAPFSRASTARLTSAEIGAGTPWASGRTAVGNGPS